jgi:hypothetical protein
MPWKECHVMDERLRFVARLLEGEKMAPPCAEFGISQDRLQDFRPLQGLRGAGLQRSKPPSTPATDFASRYLLTCEALLTTQEKSRSL